MVKYRPPRFPTDYPVTLHLGAQQAQGKVLDVNKTGVNVQLKTAALAVGDKVELRVLHHRAPAIVRWVRSNEVGLQFVPHINLQVLNTLQRR